MSDTHPGVEDEVEHALRLGPATAAQLAERVTRARQELARDARRRSEDEHRQLEARFRAEGESAAARLSVVDRPEWWNHATTQQIVSMYELAHQWRDDQPHAANAADTIARQVQDRYGIDMTSPDQLRLAVARAETDRVPTHSPAAAGERRDDLATALGSVVQADRRDAILEVAAEETVSREQRPEAPLSESHAVQEPTESGPAYDSLMRRIATAARMREAGLPEESIAVASRADIAHARPAADAATAARSAPQSTAARSAGRGEHRIVRSR